MFLQLNHQNLDIYKFSRPLVLECYQVTKKFPPDERFIFTAQNRRAALSVHLNIAESASGKIDGRKEKFFEITRDL